MSLLLCIFLPIFSMTLLLDLVKANQVKVKVAMLFGLQWQLAVR